MDALSQMRGLPVLLPALLCCPLLLLLSIPSFSTAFKLSPPGRSKERPNPGEEGGPVPPKVLVVGSTGRVGTLVTRGLVDRGYAVVCLARDPASIAARALERLPSTTVVKGDVTDLTSLQEAMQGCQACVMCSGASRVSKLSDLWRRGEESPSSYPLDHPYHVNLVGTQNVIKAAKAVGTTQKIVRVTGLSVGYSPFNTIAVLLNCVLSMAVKWQLRSELELRSSGIDYTVIRPGGLNDKGARPEDLMLASDGQPLPVGSISRQDVANLCIGALEMDEASFATFSCVTKKASEKGSASTEGGGGRKKRRRPEEEEVAPESTSRSTRVQPGSDPLVPYQQLIKREGGRDKSVLAPKAHRLAASLFLLASTTVAAALMAGLWAVSVMVAKKLGVSMAGMGSGIMAYLAAARGGGGAAAGGAEERGLAAAWSSSSSSSIMRRAATRSRGGR